MKTHRAFSLAVIVGALVLASCTDTALVFTLQDAVSGGWVWDASVRLQDRLLVSFYQTDAGPIAQKLTHLEPGDSTLSVSAPGYEPVAIPVKLGRGKNRMAAPVKLVGRSIPGLVAFSAFENLENGDIVTQLRPLDASGKAILNHPAIDLWVGCAVWEEASGGAAVTSEGDARAARGELLYRGVVPWSWDPAPESLFRYAARIPAAGMESLPSLYRVVDYLVIVPDPVSITRPELEGVLSSVWKDGGLVEGNPGRSQPARLAPRRAAALDAQKGRLRWFLLTSWDVKVRQS